jgi:phage-related protein
MAGDQVEVGILLKAVDEASDTLKSAGDSIKSLGDKANEAAGDATGMGNAVSSSSGKVANSFATANKAAIEHGREVKTMNKEYKLANMEQILMAQNLAHVGGQMKSWGANFKGSTDLIGNGLKGMYDWLGKVNPALSGMLGTGLQLIGTMATMYASYLQSSLALGKLLLAITGKSAAEIWATIVGWGHAAAQWAVNAAMYACPIVWIIAIIIALIAVIYLLITNWDKVTKAFGDFGNWAKKGLGDAWKGITEWCSNVSKAMGNAWDGMKKGAGDAVAWIGNQFKGIADKAGEWGSNLVKAFADGMAKAKKWLEDQCKNIGDTIGNFFKGLSPPPQGPLHDIDKWGKTLGETYAKGISASVPSIASSLNNMSVKPEGAGSFAYGGNGMVVNQHIYHADEDTIAQKVIDALKGLLT